MDCVIIHILVSSITNITNMVGFTSATLLSVFLCLKSLCSSVPLLLLSFVFNGYFLGGGTEAQFSPNDAPATWDFWRKMKNAGSLPLPW